jgi:hypothetical protein
MIGLLAAACTGGDSDSSPRAFKLVSEVFRPDTRTRTNVFPPLPAGWQRVEAAVIEASEVVTAGDEAEVVIELRNTGPDALSLDPCPKWLATYSGLNYTIDDRALTGTLPCDEIERIQSGERIRLGLTISAQPKADCHDGREPEFRWSLIDGFDDDSPPDATMVIPLRPRDTSPPNDCTAGSTSPTAARA